MAAALSAKEADFRLLAEQSSDMVMRVGLDERILTSHRHASDCRLDPGQLMETFRPRGVNAEDLPRVQQAMAALKLSERAEAKIIYRTAIAKRARSGSNRPAATRKPDTGEIDGFVAISRDMTQHKDLQDKLAALATSDGLTGLANRRHFDERLLEEWPEPSATAHLLSCC